MGARLIGATEIGIIGGRQEAMRIFTRQPTQSLLIGDSVSITVIAIRGLQVRLGVEAPRDINVQRGEIAGKADQRRLPRDTGK